MGRQRARASPGMLTPIASLNRSGLEFAQLNPKVERRLQLYPKPKVLPTNTTNPIKFSYTIRCNTEIGAALNLESLSTNPMPT